MAEIKPPKHDVEIENSHFPAPAFSNEQLIKMLLDSQNANAEANKKLAEALLESRKPYIDPKVLEARQEEIKQRQRDIKLELLRRSETKRQCHHHRVDDQDNMQPKLNIKWMRHSNGIIKGVCGRCMSQFDATHNPEDAKLLREDPKALNQMGRARS